MARTVPNMVDTSEIIRPVSCLQGVGAAAWQAYNAMETTKRRHFEWLEVLENKKINYNLDPTKKDQSFLQTLLNDHDEQVKRFTKASQLLKNEDVAAHGELFAYIGIINRTVDKDVVAH